MDKESLTSYTKWFNDEVRLVVDQSSFILINVNIDGLEPSKFFYLVITRPSISFPKLL